MIERRKARRVVIVAHDIVYKRLAAGGVIKLLRQDNPPAPKAALPVLTFESDPRP